MWINCDYVDHSHLLASSLSLHSDNIPWKPTPPLVFNWRHEVFLFSSKQQQRSLSETWLYCIILIPLLSLDPLIHSWPLLSPPIHSFSPPLPTRGSLSRTHHSEYTPRGLDPSLPSASASSQTVHPKRARRMGRPIQHPSPSTLVRYQMSRL